ncbi:hypothetical protein [Paenibacillus sp. KS-LC4]|uniref:hypothetical protein n=1 Tax=Paenibacillus sp. KS-LC4 TaxID=2979727 RepID=UPI0030CD445A
MSFDKGKEKEIFLHVGLHKTGTTSIQDTLHVDHNNKLLESKGYLYPKCWPSNHSIPIYSSFCDDPTAYHIHIRNGYTADQIASLNERYLNELQAEIDERKLTSLILSGEDISLLSVNNLSVYKEYLSTIFTDNIKVMIYVRSPLEWTVSAIQQFVKTGRESYKNAAAHFEKIIENLFVNRIDKFVHVFGKESVNVYSFEEAVLDKFGLVGHFLSTIGMSDKEISNVHLVTANESISLIAGDIISYINEKMPLFREKNLLGEQRSDGDIRPLWRIKGPKFDIPYFDKQRILELSRNDRAWLKKNWGIDYTSVEVLQTSVLNYELSNEKVEEIKQAALELSPILRSLVLEYLSAKSKEALAEKDAIYEFVIIAELGISEVQAVMLCESIRQFGGRYSQSGIAVISPRPDRRPGKATLQRLEGLGARYIPLSFVSPCPEYEAGFKVLVWAEYEKMSTADILVGLDSDTVFLAEPDLSLGNDNAAARPVTVQGICSTGAEDPRDAYWQSLCSLCGVDYNRLPFVVSVVDRQTVKAGYNGGFVVVRRSCGIFQRTADYFLLSVAAGLHPLTNEVRQIQAGHDPASVADSDYVGSGEACLALAIWGTGLTVRALPPGHNFPLPQYRNLRPEVESGQFGELTHIQYRDLLTAVSAKAPDFLGYYGYPKAGIAWLKESGLSRFQQAAVYVRELEQRDIELASFRKELEKIYSSNGWKILSKYYKLRDAISRIISK